MNIFVLDKDPKKAAQYYCDKHCSKMILEIAQIFCTNFHLQGIEAPYKKTHENHPSTIWARKSKANFDWLIEHVQELGREKVARFGKPHKSMEIIDWVINNQHKLSFSDEKLTPFAIAINENCECRKNPDFNENNPIQAYRLYYIHDKSYMAKWKLGNIPDWYVNIT